MKEAQSINAAQLLVAQGTFGVLDSGDIPADTADWSNGLAAPTAHGAIILTGIHTGDVQVTAQPLHTPLCSSRSCKRAAGLRARYDCVPLSMA
ncbi:hypothetical protein ACWCQ1_50655 [Streptomyces sp. NPDC002144]|uniref:hypothetical protein n=1 Tax=Streptomyces sp. NPDC006668 TaxID=3156903 RepID=UPI0033F28DC0